MLSAQNTSPNAISGDHINNGVITANAVIVCPLGNENRSGGNNVAHACGAIAHGRGRFASFFNTTNSPTPTAPAAVAAPTACAPPSPPNSNTASPTAYQSHPSPPRVAQIIHSRTHRGAIQLLQHRITTISRVAM